MLLQRLAVLIGGFAAGALVRRFQGDTAPSQRSLDRATREWKAQARAHDRRLALLENRTEAHEARLKELPSTAEIVSTMDDLLDKAMSGLDERLTAQAQSIETLRMTVSQTDELLERVLESLDTLHDEDRAQR